MDKMLGGSIFTEEELKCLHSTVLERTHHWGRLDEKHAGEDKTVHEIFKRHVIILGKLEKEADKLKWGKLQ